MSWQAARSARSSSVSRMAIYQNRALDTGNYSQAFGIRKTISHDDSSIKKPKRLSNGDLVWTFN